MACGLAYLIEMGEEMGSPGLYQICAMEKDALAADVLITSDGPRIDPHKPTLFGGSRAVFNVSSGEGQKSIGSVFQSRFWQNQDELD